MTKTRFIRSNRLGDYCIIDKNTNKPLTLVEIVDLLNLFVEENKNMIELEEECRQYLATNIRLLELIEKYEEEVILLKKENKRLMLEGCIVE